MERESHEVMGRIEIEGLEERDMPRLATEIVWV
jgi:hypothetical protein